jgi:hypothetical protein
MCGMKPEKYNIFSLEQAMRFSETVADNAAKRNTYWMASSNNYQFKNEN